MLWSCQSSLRPIPHLQKQKFLTLLTSLQVLLVAVVFLLVAVVLTVYLESPSRPAEYQNIAHSYKEKFLTLLTSLEQLLTAVVFSTIIYIEPPSRPAEQRQLSGVNRQGKWDTFETRVNRHFRACSYSGKAVDYHSKGGVSHGATNHRAVLAS